MAHSYNTSQTGLPQIKENKRFKTIDYDQTITRQEEVQEPPSPMNAKKEKKLRKAMNLLPPMQVSGPRLVDSDRIVLWR